MSHLHKEGVSHSVNGRQAGNLALITFISPNVQVIADLHGDPDAWSIPGELQVCLSLWLRPGDQQCPSDDTTTVKADFLHMPWLMEQTCDRWTKPLALKPFKRTNIPKGFTVATMASKI